MYYYGARWYDPSIGRFISQDSLAGHKSNPQTLNPYVYVTDSPTGFTDPSGMDSRGGGFLGFFDQYVSKPYLDWFDRNVEVPVVTFECGCNRASVEHAVNQNAGLETTLFDTGVVASAVVVTCALACPAIATALQSALGVGGSAGAAGTGVTTVTSACSVDEPACALE